jgi:hypothetical protein
MASFAIRALSAASLALGIASFAPLPALAEGAGAHDFAGAQIADNTPTIIQQIFSPPQPTPPPVNPPAVAGVRG